MPFKSEKQRKWMHANQPEMAKKWEKEEESVEEAAKRDYKDEYKKFQSSDKSKKYRAELNKYNRKKGTYGNGDGKDASHKGGKISGFEKESVNRGRREKSRLKKEQKLKEVIYRLVSEALNEATTQLSIPLSAFDKVKKLLKPKTNQIVKHSFSKKTFGLKINKNQENKILDLLIRKGVKGITSEGFAGSLKKSDRKEFENIRTKQSEVLGYKLTGTPDVKVEIDDATIKEGKLTERKAHLKNVLKK